jgi:transcriptional regulator with XRE-family HTH domain
MPTTIRSKSSARKVADTSTPGRARPSVKGAAPASPEALRKASRKTPPKVSPQSRAATPAAARRSDSPGAAASRQPSTPVDLQIGARLKHARLLAGVRMRELATKVGCTEGMISKIENARVVPSLPMLQRLVEALGRDLPSFFGSNPDAPGTVLRAGQRPIATTDPIRKGRGVHYERLVPFGAGNLLEGNIHVVAPDGVKHDPITHQGETVGYVIQGPLELGIEGTTYQLNTGDSFFFKNHLTNHYRNPGPGEARVLWVNTPQVH